VYSQVSIRNQAHVKSIGGYMTKEQFKKVTLRASYRNIFEALWVFIVEGFESFTLFVINTFFIILLILIIPVYLIIYFVLKNWTLLTWKARQKKIDKEVQAHMERQFGKTQRSK